MGSESTFAAGFDEAGFREAIKQTMKMGMPEDPAQRLIWKWRRDRTYNPQDRIRKPYTWTQPPITDQPGNPDEPDGELSVDYAMEFSARGSQGDAETALGRFNTSRATVTLMDQDYELIKDADYCILGGAEYEIDFVGPPMGLFAVTVFQVYIKARDEV